MASEEEIPEPLHPLATHRPGRSGTGGDEPAVGGHREQPAAVLGDRGGARSGHLGHDLGRQHMLVVTDPARARDFWADVMGAELYTSMAEPAWCCDSLVPGCCW